MEEDFSLAYSLERLCGRDVIFVTPETMDISYYKRRSPQSRFEYFADAYFKSISGYNQLLLNDLFYRRFDSLEFMLILQSDAIILRDELDYWCAQSADWIGAPWPSGQMLTIKTEPFSQERPKPIHTHVGNGGLSLRRIQPTLQLLAEFAETRDDFVEKDWNEDLFFSLLGTQSLSFRIPNERVASLFALEVNPEHYVGLNQGKLPMGGHAWYRHNLDFWLPVLDQQPPTALMAMRKPRKTSRLWERLLSRGNI
jgi:hypothetical protein